MWRPPIDSWGLVPEQLRQDPTQGESVGVEEIDC